MTAREHREREVERIADRICYEMTGCYVRHGGEEADAAIRVARYVLRLLAAERRKGIERTIRVASLAGRFGWTDDVVRAHIKKETAK